MEHVVDIKHHLGEQPVVGFIQGSVDEVGSSIGLDCEREKVVGFGVEEEVSRAGGSIPLGLQFRLLIGLLMAVFLKVRDIIEATGSCGGAHGRHRKVSQQTSAPRG